MSCMPHVTLCWGPTMSLVFSCLIGGVTAVAKGASIAGLGAETKVADILGHARIIILCDGFDGISWIGLGCSTCEQVCGRLLFNYHHFILPLCLQLILPNKVCTDFLKCLFRMLRLRALHLLQEELRLANVRILFPVSVGTLDVRETGLRSSILSISLCAIFTFHASEITTEIFSLIGIVIA